MNTKIISSLYELYKNTPKKLKIVCDWDEVIQACESYALWKIILDNPYLSKRIEEEKQENNFQGYFENF
jgi:hypothetical protein